MKLVKIQNPFDHTKREVLTVRNKSLHYLVKKHAPANLPYIVSLNGHVIPNDQLKTVKLTKNDYVIIMPKLEGNGDNGKGVIGAVVIIAAMALGQEYLAPYLAYYVEGMSLTAAEFVVGAGIAIGGGMVVNALTPGPNGLNAAGSDIEKSQAYSWNPQTLQQQGLAIPRYYGKNKLVGQVISNYTESLGDKQYIHALILLGMGPFNKIGVDLSMWINDQINPLNNLQGVEIQSTLGLLNQDILPGFNDTKIEYPTSIKITRNLYKTSTTYNFNDVVTPTTLNEHSYKCIVGGSSGSSEPTWPTSSGGTVVDGTVTWQENGKPGALYTTVSDNFNAIELDITFPQGIWKINDKGNTVETEIQLSIEVSLDEVNWFPLTQSGSDVVVSGQGYWSPGLWTVPGMGGLDMATGPNDPNKRWTQISESLRTLMGLTLSTDPYAHQNGEIVKSNTAYVPFYDGFYIWQWIGLSTQIANTSLPYWTATGSKTTPKKFTVKTKSFATAQHKFRIFRRTEDNTDPKIGSDFYLTAVREVYYDDFEYPRQALVAVRALATDQLSGSFRFACIAECLKVRVWNGSSWSVEYSTNPAWIFYDAATQPVYDNSFNVIRYEGYDPAYLNSADHYKEWAEWCDGLVVANDGGTEKRCTFNGGFDAGGNLWDALIQIAAVGRAAPLWIGTKLSVVIDKPSDPVQMFTIGNIITDEFEQSWLSMDERSKDIEIDFINAENGYEREKLAITHPSFDGNGDPASLQLFGVTNPSEVWRHGMLKLENNKNVKMIANWDADIDAIATMVGDVCLVQHSIPKWGIGGGRILAATTTELTLDQYITLEAGKSYNFTIRLRDDSIVTKNITTGAGTWNVVSIDPPFESYQLVDEDGNHLIDEDLFYLSEGSVASPYDLFSAGEGNTHTKPFRVTSIRRTSDQRATISGIEYVDTATPVDSNRPVIQPPNYSTLEMYPKVSNISAVEQLVNRQGFAIDDYIIVTFTPPEYNYLHAEVWYTVGASWIFVGTTRDSLSFLCQPDLAYTIAVLTVNGTGRKMLLQNAPIATVNTLGLKTPLANVIALNIIYQGTQAFLTWHPITDVRPFVYEVRFGDEYSKAMILGTTAGTTFITQGNGTYWVAAKSELSMSATPATLTITGSTLVKNVVATYDEFGLSWPGTLSGAAEIDIAGRVWLKNISGVVQTPGYYESTNIVDIGSPQPCQLSCDYNASSDNPNNLVDDWADWDTVASVDGEYAGFSNVKIQIALSQDGSTYGDWADFVPGPYTLQSVKWRAELTSINESITAVLAAFSFTVDMPDRVEVFTNQAIAAGGTAVTFAHPFQLVPNVQIAILNAAAGDTVVFLAGPTANGLTLQITNGGVGVGRNVNIFAQGY